MARSAPSLVTPKGPSKSIFQPHPSTVGYVPTPGTSTTPSAGKPGKATPPNGGSPA
jgi:hypothetical protein